jgi:hypothetical protein
MTLKRVALFVGGALALGIILGTVIFPPKEGPTKWKVIHDTETVTKTKEVKVAAPAPKACADALAFAEKIVQASNQYELSSSELLSIISGTRIVMSTHDVQAANSLTQRMYDLEPKTIEAAEVLGLNKTPFASASRACLKATQP